MSIVYSMRYIKGLLPLLRQSLVGVSIIQLIIKTITRLAIHSFTCVVRRLALAIIIDWIGQLAIVAVAVTA